MQENVNLGTRLTFTSHQPALTPSCTLSIQGFTHCCSINWLSITHFKPTHNKLCFHGFQFYECIMHGVNLHGEKVSIKMIFIAKNLSPPVQSTMHSSPVIVDHCYQFTQCYMHGSYANSDKSETYAQLKDKILCSLHTIIKFL